MKTNEELFNFLEELVEELSTLNREDARAAADRIRIAAGISSVGTEILMALRKELIELFQTTIQLDNSTREKLKEAIYGINSELAR